MSQQINLFDARFQRQKRHFSAATLAATLAAVLVLALAIQQLYAYQSRSLQASVAQTDARVAQLRDQVARFAREFGAQGGSTALADEIARTEEALRVRRGLLASMQTGAGTAEGFSAYLAALARRTTQGVWLTGIDIDGSLVIKGRALDGERVPAYIRQLNREETFAGRTVSELRMSARPEDALEFSFSIPLGKDPS
ncbi:MAG TPA: PilN domain-containing protein [Burkholderiales bacterium]|nr:PilN domain-containing protein [Burkholderiales bacterium]